MAPATQNKLATYNIKVMVVSITSKNHSFIILFNTLLSKRFIFSNFSFHIRDTKSPLVNQTTEKQVITVQKNKAVFLKSSLNSHDGSNWP
jgi:hypothetical protein